MPPTTRRDTRLNESVAKATRANPAPNPWLPGHADRANLLANSCPEIARIGVAIDRSEVRPGARPDALGGHSLAMVCEREQGISLDKG